MMIMVGDREVGLFFSCMDNAAHWSDKQGGNRWVVSVGSDEELTPEFKRIWPF